MKRTLTYLATFLSVILTSAVAFAQEAGASASSGVSSNAWYAISAGLAIALASFGGAIGQSRAAASALEGISRNPGAAGKVQTPMIIALALIESLVIYALVIAFLIQGKIA